MFSKIKSLCKKFYKSRKSVASFVLAMMLAFSAFIGTGIKSEAAYTTQKFYFDLSGVKQSLSPLIGSQHYFYIFKATSHNKRTSRKVEFNSVNYDVYPFYYYYGSANNQLYGSKYIATITGSH